MRSVRTKRLCAYCGQPGAKERDHVIARQFVPLGQAYRDDLPRVPSCGTCNRKKQQVEDGPAVLFQFCDGGDASGHVLKKEVPKRLAGNRPLYASLRENLQEVLVRTPGGILIPSLGINLSPRMLSDIYLWYQFVTKGLYYFEHKHPLPTDHSMHLLRPTDERFNMFTDMILHNPNHQRRSFAGGEFQYAFVVNHEDEMSLWLYAFKSINMFVLTLSPTFPADTKSSIKKIEWPPPEEESGSA